MARPRAFSIRPSCVATVAVLAFNLSVANAYNMAPDHGYMVEFGGLQSVERWSAGIDYDSSGTYILLGHGLGEQLLVYWEVFSVNPVLNNAVENPLNASKRADISPNTYIIGFGLGARGIPWRNDKWALLADFGYSSMAEFNDFVEWSNGVYSHIHMTDIATFAGSLVVVRDFGPVDVVLGASLRSTFAHGEIVTAMAAQPDVFTEFDERDKLAVKGVLGFNYELNEHWILFLQGAVGNGFSGRIGFNRSFK